jgi:Calcineurin-like phosphoesterase
VSRAGWRDERPRSYGAAWEELLRGRKLTKWGNFTWISPAPLLASINDQVVRGLDDLVAALRMRWVASVRRGDYNRGRLTIGLFAYEMDFSFLVLGDPGEQDASQYAVVAPLLEKGKDTRFMVICSDVIYPAGDINQYIDGFYLSYRDYKAPIYALPGNHDWYDGLNGFMFHFCGAEPLPPVAYRAGSYSWKERLARVLWRKPSPPDMPAVLHERDLFVDGDWKPVQPGPYHAIATKSLMVISIDTGITGKLDADQGEWLRRVSCDPRPKVLLTGKPIYVDGKYDAGKIGWSKSENDPCTVDDIVRDPKHRYVAAIGGDVHNYQRYSVGLRGAEAVWPDGTSRPRLEYIVSGGGGAYLSATHRFGRVDLNREVDKSLPDIEPIHEEKNFWCYPLRGDSLARFARRFGPTMAATLAIAIAVIVGTLLVLVVPLRGFDQTVAGDKLEAWRAIYLTPLTLAAVALILFLASKISKALPRGYRTLSATTLSIALAALLVLLLNVTFGDGWTDVLHMIFASLIAAGGPVLIVVSYYLLRDFIAPSVRAGIALAIPVGLVAGVVAHDVSIRAEGAVLTAGALATLWVSVLVIGRLRTPDGSPEEHKIRVRFAGILPPLLGAAGLIALLYIIRDEWFIPSMVLAAGTALLVFLALLLILMGWHGLLAARWIFFRQNDLDPDKAARWIGDRLGVEPVRESARQATVDLKTRALANLTYRTWPVKKFISELAEATTPPFFKNFLRIDMTDGKLKITAYGVTGWGDEETEPTVEDEVEIDLPTTVSSTQATRSAF